MRKLSYLATFLVATLFFAGAFSGCEKKGKRLTIETEKLQNKAGEDHNNALDLYLNNFKQKKTNDKDISNEIIFENIKEFLLSEYHDEYDSTALIIGIDKTTQLFKEFLNQTNKTGETKSLLELALQEQSVTDNQKYYFDKVNRIASNKIITFDELIQQISLLQEEAEAIENDEEKQIVLYSLSIAISTFTYWHENIDEVQKSLQGDGVYTPWTWTDFGLSDLAGGVCGGLGAAAAGVGGGIVGGACLGSLAYCIVSL